VIRTPAVHRHLSFNPLEWGCKPELQKVPPRTERARISLQSGYSGKFAVATPLKQDFGTAGRC
jgi:hypothetical protein